MLRTYTPEEKYHSNYRWLMLALSAFTPMLVLAMPMMSLPVLFPEIQADLNLTLIEVGWIWAVSSITGMFVGLIGGTIGDRFGARRTLIALCLLTGVTGALRGYAVNFPTFIITSFLLGLVQPAIAVTSSKLRVSGFVRSS